MPTRHIYLKIEDIADYSPVEPSSHAAAKYRRDCMRNTGHENASIPLSEINARRLTALTYREYLDPDFLIPKPDKLILADINEPLYTHRVPGTVIYTKPGERLHIHVLNADIMPHSLHVHGLRYGIDSDGSWPFGTQASDGRRSDEICPGQTWTYRFAVTEEMIGAWPFHDHSRHIGESVNRGLFGGIIVLPKDHHPPKKAELPQLAASFSKRCCRELGEDEDLDPAVGLGAPGHGHAHDDHDHENHDHEDDHDDHDHNDHDHHRHGGGGHGHGGHGGSGHGGGGGGHGGGQGGHGGGHGHRKGRDPEHQGVLDFLEEYFQLDYAHPKCDEKDVLHVPIFLHTMNRGHGSIPAFNSGPFSPAAPPFEVVLGAEGSFGYHCEIHPQMQGTVIVALGEPVEATVAIADTNMLDMRFDPLEVRVRPGGKVRWMPGTMVHTVTEDGGGIPSLCFNGRSFVGNTPTIVARAGQRIRWYVFNLDLGMGWHNFHPHAQRWRFAQEALDVRSIGPAESFIVDTVAPPVLLLPVDIEKAQDDKDRPKGAKKYELCGDFLMHCHVEMHMMQGLAALVRSKQTVWLTPQQADRLKAKMGLPQETCEDQCPSVDPTRCERLLCGEWQLVPGSPEVCMMHACLLPNTLKVLYFGYGDTRDDQSRAWDYTADPGVFSAPVNQPFNVSQPPNNRALANIWSAEHDYLNDAQGTILVNGGFTPRETYLFNPATLSWSRKQQTAHERFYSTTLIRADSRLVTLFGSASKSFEIYDPGAGSWSAPVAMPAAMHHHEFYPWTFLLPGGKFFIAGPHVPTQRFNLAAGGINNLEPFATIAGDRSSGGEKGTCVLLPLRPPNYEPRVLIAGGDFTAAQQTAEWIDLSSATPAWQSLPDLNLARAQQVNSVLLPDGQVLIAGGIDGADGGPAELFDPGDPSAGWALCATMSIPRGYHSAAILLADGSVLMGGDRPGAWKSGETTQHERYYPAYFTYARPLITGAPQSVVYGAMFAVQTPNPGGIAEVVLVRPGAVTHGFNMAQRLVECAITAVNPGEVQAQAPPDGNVAPPGYYLLFLLTAGRVPSIGRWIRLS